MATRKGRGCVGRFWQKRKKKKRKEKKKKEKKKKKKEKKKMKMKKKGENLGITKVDYIGWKANAGNFTNKTRYKLKELV